MCFCNFVICVFRFLVCVSVLLSYMFQGFYCVHLYFCYMIFHGFCCMFKYFCHMCDRVSIV